MRLLEPTDVSCCAIPKEAPVGPLAIPLCLPWIGSNQRMLRFFGGVLDLLAPNNLKAAATRASRYASKINVTYAEMAAHYKPKKKRIAA